MGGSWKRDGCSRADLYRRRPNGCPSRRRLCRQRGKGLGGEGVGREEGLDRELGQGDLDGRAEDRDGADEAEDAGRRVQLQGNGDVDDAAGRLDLSIGLTRWQGEGAQLLGQLGEHRVATGLYLMCEPFEQVVAPG